MESLAESGMEHPELRVCMDIETWLGEQKLKVKVYDTAFNVKASQDYVIIDYLSDSYDVLKHTVENAIAEMQKRDAEKIEEEESTTDTK